MSFLSRIALGGAGIAALLLASACKQKIESGGDPLPVQAPAGGPQPFPTGGGPSPMPSLPPGTRASPPAARTPDTSKVTYFPTKTDRGFCEGAGAGLGAFRARRGGGSRLHAACDVYNPQGTPIHAVADGTVLDDGYAFYCSTDAVEVDHGTFVVRYGEIRPRSAKVKKGQRVKAGQVIALTGVLDCYHQPMLHFEMFSGKASGQLSRPGSGEFGRRSDLMNPTSWLKSHHAKKPP